MSYFEAYQSCFLFGSLRYFANLQDSVCLINGPSGCSFYARNAIINLNGYFEKEKDIGIPKIFTIDFSEEDVIFGNEDKLRKAIYEIIEHHNPKMIFVFNCCVSEIIGVDIDRIVEEVSEEKDVRVVAIHSAGFKGDHKLGMHTAANILVENFIKEKKTINFKKVNLLGDFDYFNRSTKVLSAVLNKIGIDEITHIPGKCSIEELSEASAACLNIITCQNASRHLAELLKDKFGTAYIGAGLSLYGLKNCFDFYSEIYHFFNIDISSLEQEFEDYQKEILKYQSTFKDKKAAVVAGTKRAIGYSAILKELGFQVELIFTEGNKNYFSKETFSKYSQNVLLDVKTSNLAEQIKRIDPDVIFTTLPEMIAPNSYFPRLAEDFSGFDGVIRMAEYLYTHFNRVDREQVVLITE